MDPQLLTTKLHIPQLRPNLVPRRRLTERLDEALRLGHCLLLVCAPAGFGKTTLLSEWIHDRRRPAAWVSLDENDNDPVTFWTHFIAALRAGLPDVGEDTLGEGLLTVLHSPASAREGAPFGIDRPLATLLNEIAELSVPVVIVFDDYHLIENQRIHDALSFLLEHSPPQMHAVIASRIDPPLPLARLRGRYQLTEVREADLRFTRVETVAFLNETMSLGLTEDSMAALETSTEGWIVGLQLAALALQGMLSLKGKETACVEEFMQAFGGSHRHIIDYLVEEVLQQQTDEIQDFLFQTAVLDRLTAPLCDALTGRVDTQAMLTQLEHANLFLVPLDERREWYRYHHLFADFLRFQAKLQPQDLAILHQKAAQWYEANGFMAEAIKHALAAGDTVDAARMISLAAEDTLRHARFVTFFNWLDALPEEFVRADYDLATTKGCALMLAGDLAAADALAQTAAHSLPADAPSSARAKVVCLQALLALTYRSREDDRKGAIQQAVEALLLIGDTNPLFRAMLLTQLGEAQRLHGDPAAVHTLREAVDLNQRIDNPIMSVIAMSNLAALLFQQGRRREATLLCQETIARYVDAHGRPMPPAGVAYVILATMHYEANELEQTHHCLLSGLTLNEHMALIAINLMGKTLLAQLQQARGETQAALKTIRETCQSITKENAWRRTALAAKAVEVSLQLKQGDVASVARWAETMHLSPTDALSYVRMPIYLAYARLLLAQNRPKEAQTLLTRLERTAQRDHLHGNLVTIHALQALTKQAQGQADQALLHLRRALILAAPEDYYRSLLDEGPPLAELLFKAQAHLGESVDPLFARNLLEAFRAELEHAPAQAALLVEPLTERELEVLQLIIAGLSNREIAAELFLAMGTVKKHITNIYGKLGVRRRAQAIARARELDMQ